MTPIRSLIRPDFLVKIDHGRCNLCKRCLLDCSFGVLKYDEEMDRIVAEDVGCVACHRCVVFCPKEAITVVGNPLAYKDQGTWTKRVQGDIRIRAETGAVPLVGGGTDLFYPCILDHILIDACQVTNPSIDPLREPMELRTYLGRKAPKLEVLELSEGRFTLKTRISKNIKLETPITFAAMSYGAVSLEVHKVLAMVAREKGITMNSGEGGLHRDLFPYGDHIIVQVASGRFGVHKEYLDVAAGIEIKIGQGAKPGIGGHLPGEKITPEIAETRMIPIGTDALSPAPHHDIYSIEDLSQLVYALKEATEYRKPVFVKIAAVHNVAQIASGIARSGADGIVVDGFRGGTGAAPQIIRDHLGIPIELAIAAVDDRLREEGIRSEASIIASGGIRSSADVAKIIALGADAVGIATAALIAMGCNVCGQCYTGLCPWGLTTQRPDLRKRLNVKEGVERVSNLIAVWSKELEEILGALGMNSIESLRGNRERLRGVGLDSTTLEILGIEPAGR
ncbi:MAG: glutamate synthase-related protein [Candidatus Bathyarchaeia archaeon]